MPTAALALILVLSASDAAAVPPSPAETGHVVKEPDWKRRPTGEDVARLWGAKQSAVTKIRCKVDVNGKLHACVVLSETPPGVGAGATGLKLIPQFQMTPKLIDGKPVDGGEVTIPIHLDMGGPSERYLNHPVWLQAPTVAQVRAAFPAQADVDIGKVTLDCNLPSDGRLDACRVAEEIPAFKGFARAALSLHGSFRAEPDPAMAPQHIPLRAIVTIAFDRSLAPPYLTRPDWLSRPAAQQATSVFPAQAAKAGLKTGRAVADCAVGADGVLTDCRIASEDPAGAGFGEAAVQLTGYMKLSAWTQDGHPTAGARLQLPIRLNAGAEAAPQPAAKP